MKVPIKMSHMHWCLIIYICSLILLFIRLVQTKISQKFPSISNEHLPSTAKFQWNNYSIFIVYFPICERKTNISLSEEKNLNQEFNVENSNSQEGCNKNIAHFQCFLIVSKCSNVANRLSLSDVFHSNSRCVASCVN